jgi:transposase-like protein
VCNRYEKGKFVQMQTYIKVKGQWMYLYRAVDSKGNTIDFYLSKTRDRKAEKRFLKKALRSFHVSKLRVITVDKNPDYPVAIQQLKNEKKDAGRHPDETNSIFERYRRTRSSFYQKVCPFQTSVIFALEPGIFL